jgi:hypothetical protein
MGLSRKLMNLTLFGDYDSQVSKGTAEYIHRYECSSVLT